VIAIVAFVALAVAFCAIEARWPARAQRRWRRGMWTDLAFGVATPVIARVLAFVSIAVVALGVAAIAGVRPDREHLEPLVFRDTWVTTLPVGVQAALVVVVGDGMGYWMHRLAHRRALWRFHKLHHSSQDLDWLSSVRVHPFDTFVSRTIHIIPLVAVGFDPRVLAAYVPLLHLYAILLHANVPWTFGPLRFAIASPAFHRWHHSADAPHCNFAGLFPIWDLAFGTFHLPATQPLQFGLSTSASPQ
jgi:sterol desaturase/sphingolipid hydroxylase (fatty acid hydroxylase superfamily)